MKYINQAKKFAKRGAATVVVAAFSGAAFASGEGGADPFSAIDLTGVAVKIGAAGLLIIGITMAYKSITLAKRAVKLA